MRQVLRYSHEFGVAFCFVRPSQITCLPFPADSPRFTTARHSNPDYFPVNEKAPSMAPGFTASFRA